MSKLWEFVDRRSIAYADTVVTAATLAVAGIMALWLVGCAQIGQFTADDAQNAATVAAKVGDKAGAACWPVLQVTGAAISSVGNKPGIFVGIEEKRAVQLALQNTTCQPIWTDVLAELLKSSPAAPLIP